jgi:hypothetical protein
VNVHACMDVLVCCFRFSYHRTEGQELSMQCLGRRTKASVKNLLYYHENFCEEVLLCTFYLWYISSHSIIGIGAS